MPRSSAGSATTFGFPIDGRTPQEVEKMKKYGYAEEPDFSSDRLRQDGYFCSSCSAFESIKDFIEGNPTSHDGYCHKFQFKDRSYGCCCGWTRSK